MKLFMTSYIKTFIKSYMKSFACRRPLNYELRRDLGCENARKLWKRSFRIPINLFQKFFLRKNLVTHMRRFHNEEEGEEDEDEDEDEAKKQNSGDTNEVASTAPVWSKTRTAHNCSFCSKSFFYAQAGWPDVTKWHLITTFLLNVLRFQQKFLVLPAYLKIKGRNAKKFYKLESVSATV
jgi:hypothetical protein